MRINIIIIARCFVTNDVNGFRYDYRTQLISALIRGSH